MGNIITKYLPDYQMVFASKNISVSHLEKAPFYMEMDVSLSHTLISNLLKNSFVHNCNNGTIDITVDGSFIEIRNSGSNVALNEELIFEKFYHSSENNNSVGLGLSIVKAICNLYKIEIVYSFKGGLHSFKLIQ